MEVTCAAKIDCRYLAHNARQAALSSPKSQKMLPLPAELSATGVLTGNPRLPEDAVELAHRQTAAIKLWIVNHVAHT